MTIQEALQGSPAPRDVLDQLRLVELPYIGFSGKEEKGWMVVHGDLEAEVVAIFRQLAHLRFPIERVEPVSLYNWDDHASMAANNTSAFNWRMIEHTSERSWHSYGRAIDINPRTNPYFGYAGVEPKGAVYDPEAQGAITAEGPVVAIFKEKGWEWLGDRTEHKDYQHFQRPS